MSSVQEGPTKKDHSHMNPVKGENSKISAAHSGKKRASSRSGNSAGTSADAPVASQLGGKEENLDQVVPSSCRKIANTNGISENQSLVSGTHKHSNEISTSDPIKDDRCSALSGIRLPSKVQHIILVTLQRRLEQAAFEFTQKNPFWDLDKKGWSCAEEVEWNEWLKHVLKPENKHLLPDVSQNIGSLSARDLLKQAFDIRHDAVHRDYASGHDVIGLMRVARDMFIAFNDSKGALMAHKYIAISLEIAAATERNNEEIYTLQTLAERESKMAISTTFLSIRARLENRLQSQLEPLLYVAANIESEALLEPVSPSFPQKQSTPNTAQKTVELLIQQPLEALLLAHLVIIIGMLYALQCIDT